MYGNYRNISINNICVQFNTIAYSDRERNGIATLTYLYDSNSGIITVYTNDNGIFRGDKGNTAAKVFII